LFIAYYNDKNILRQQENDFCLKHNVNNNLITNVYLIIDNKNTIIPDDIKKSDKIKIIYIDSRPTFQTLFVIINKNTNKNDINILANTDIYFDDTLKLLYTSLKHDMCFALTRWDVNHDDSITFLNHDYSQDTWIFRGQIKNENMEANFFQGIQACDNRVAYEIKNAGYKIYNPSKTIITYHLHKTNIRNYDPNNYLQGNGIHVKSCYLDNLIRA
jgi:hypothetical protein